MQQITPYVAQLLPATKQFPTPQLLKDLSFRSAAVSREESAVPALIDSPPSLCENPRSSIRPSRTNIHEHFAPRPLLSGPILLSSPPRMVTADLWMFCIVPALIAGVTDWRTRRIPNWLTVSTLLLGFAVNAAASRWLGAKEALLGMLLGLALLLPFVLLRALGAGDWKLVGALGAWLGPARLITVLILAIFAAGIMAVALIVAKRRVRRTLRNIGHMLAALFTLHLPGAELSLDNPDSAKVPFGVAVALAVLFYVGAEGWRIAHLH